MQKTVIYIAAPLLLLLFIFPLVMKNSRTMVNSYEVCRMQSGLTDTKSTSKIGNYSIAVQTGINRTARKNVDGYDFNFNIGLYKNELLAGRAAFSGSGYWSPNVENGRFFRELKIDNPHGLLHGANCYAVKTPEGMFFVIRYAIETSGHRLVSDVTFPLSADDEISDPVQLPAMKALETAELASYNAKDNAR